MLIRIQHIEGDGLRMAGTLGPPRDPSAPGDVQIGAIAFAVELTREESVVGLTGWFRTHVSESCSRCLEPVRRRVERDLEIRFQPEELAPADPETELDETDLNIEYYSGESLDLRAILAQQVMLEAPLKILCDEDCKGLCSQCGTNLNEQSCDCEPPVDPRLSKLIDLRDRL